jgi:hypothetical protein
MSALLQRLLKIHPREVEFARRGFICFSAETRDRLENIGHVFLRGYHAALQETDHNVLAEDLNRVDLGHRGFAYEGAGMALALIDRLGLRRNVFSSFAAGAGKQHTFMLHVGAGWAYARLPWLRWRIEQAIKNLHPVLRWLVVDGYGFHQGHSTSALSHLSIEARHVFYQGLGRSLWFVNGANVQKISASISGFPLLYHSDAWSGVGLACAYAGGLEQNLILELRCEAGMHAPALAQGVAFAAKARQLAGNPQKHTDLACALLCGMCAEEAADLCDETFRQIDMLHPCPYRHWRELLQKSFPLKLFSSVLFSSQTFLRGNSHEPIEPSPVVAAKLH